MKLSVSALFAGAIVITAAFVGGMMTAGVRAHQSLVAYEDSLHRADVALEQRDRELAGARARTDTADRRVAQLLAIAAADTEWRRDTVYVAGDSTPRLAVPLPTVLRQDATNAACQLLAVTCKAERVAAENRADAAEHKLQIALTKPERSCRSAFLWGAAAGAAGDEVLHGRIRIPLLSFSR